MADTTYTLNFTEMDEAIAAAKQRAQNIQSLLEEMNTSTSSSLSSWTGDAQSAYAEAYNTCITVAYQMPETLESARSTLSSIATAYQNAETSVTSSFSV